MWRRLYFLLIIVRIYFALSPSYLHPDENFQGPEVVAGMPCLPCSENTWPSSKLTSPNRTRLFLPRPRNMGIHLRIPHPQHFPAMAGLRLAHVYPALAMGGLWI